jgi:uncharacterized protein (DUF2236 family)
VTTFVDARVSELRRALSARIVSRVGGPDAASHRAEVLEAPGDRWFAEDSPVRVIHADTAMFVGGLLAVLRQSLHPLAMAGVAQHSTYREDPWGRLHRTASFLGAVTFGPSEMAERAVATVRRIHGPVRGRARDGRPYAASDPHLLLWVHLAELESFVTAHRVYGATRLDAADYDRYVAEMSRVAVALGSEAPPRSRVELRDALAGFKAELAASPEARQAARYLIAPPGLSLTERVGYAPLVAAAIALLPVDARIGLRLPILPITDRFLVPAITGGALRLARWVHQDRDPDSDLDADLESD